MTVLVAGHGLGAAAAYHHCCLPLDGVFGVLFQDSDGNSHDDRFGLGRSLAHEHNADFAEAQFVARVEIRIVNRVT